MSKNKYVIIHGQLHQISDEELMHWGIFKKKNQPRKDHKYVKREWKNGKWVYTYPEDTKTTNVNFKNTVEKGFSVFKKLFKEPKSLTERKEYKEAEKKLSDTKKRLDIAKKNYDKVRDRAYEDNHLTDVEKRLITSYKNDYNKRTDENIKAGEKYLKEQNDYFKTPLSKLENASTKVTNFFKTLFGKSEGKSEYEKLQEESRLRTDEEERQRRGAYVEAQTDERNGVRSDELKSLLEQLKKPDEWYNKLIGKNNNPLPELQLKQSATTLDDDMRMVNPNYKNAKTSFDENCGACSIAYDLRRRGYDIEVVSETEWLTHGGTTTDLMECYKGSELISLDDIKNKYKVSGNAKGMSKYVDRDILAYGDGARGNINFVWKSGGGHSISWEVENGEVVYRDCQTNEKIEISDYASYSSNILYMRTDNLELTEECYKYVRNRKG